MAVTRKSKQPACWCYGMEAEPVSDIPAHALALSAHYESLRRSGVPPEVAAQLTVIAAQKLDGLAVEI